MNNCLCLHNYPISSINTCSAGAAYIQITCKDWFDQVQECKGIFEILIFQRHIQANIPFTTMGILNYLRIVGFYGQLAIAILLIITYKS